MSTERRRLADRYELEDAIGRGGMGQVWRATDTVLGREVAVKTIDLRTVPDESGAARFEREARVTAGMSHPNIVTVHDSGVEGDTAFLVMELLPGPSLAERLREGPLPVAEVEEVGRQVAAALDAAHARGLVHRDIKPGNIVYAADGRVRVLDFGITQLAESTGSQALTATHTVMGTAEYLAPEQAMGGRVDGRADLYALGCVLYALLAGRPPFSGPTPVATMMMHANDPVPDLARGPPRDARLARRPRHRACSPRTPTRVRPERPRSSPRSRGGWRRRAPPRPPCSRRGTPPPGWSRRRRPWRPSRRRRRPRARTRSGGGSAPAMWVLAAVAVLALALLGWWALSSRSEPTSSSDRHHDRERVRRPRPPRPPPSTHRDAHDTAAHHGELPPPPRTPPRPSAPPSRRSPTRSGPSSRTARSTRTRPRTSTPGRGTSRRRCATGTPWRSPTRWTGCRSTYAAAVEDGKVSPEAAASLDPLLADLQAAVDGLGG